MFTKIHSLCYKQDILATISPVNSIKSPNASSLIEKNIQNLLEK